MTRSLLWHATPDIKPHIWIMFYQNHNFWFCKKTHLESIWYFPKSKSPDFDKCFYLNLNHQNWNHLIWRHFRSKFDFPVGHLRNRTKLILFFIENQPNWNISRANQISVKNVRENVSLQQVHSEPSAFRESALPKKSLFHSSGISEPSWIGLELDCLARRDVEVSLWNWQGGTSLKTLKSFAISWSACNFLNLLPNIFGAQHWHSISIFG